MLQDNKRKSRWRTWVFLIFIFAPLAYSLFWAAGRITSGLVVPSTLCIAISAVIAAIATALTALVANRRDKWKYAENVLGAWFGVFIFSIIGLANLETLLPGAKRGHCIRQIIGKRDSQRKKWSADSYRFVFFDFDGEEGTSTVGVGPEIFREHVSGEVLELELDRSLLGSVSLVSVGRYENAPAGELRKACW